ncbi:MAG: peptidoglycan recognition protein family protein [Deltaproteobacteria bacterium]|nr:peptidoglycan recognition protein family protein [Deltaproteobacteria bacterium]
MPASSVPIVDRPIRFGAERKRLTIEYRRQHQDPGANSIDIEPRMIVIHHTGGNSAEGTWRYFNRVRAESGRKRLARAGAVGVSSHFVVARDGTVLRLMPETWMARHVIGLNHVAIGVENVGDLDRHPLTDAQLEANQRLVRYLVANHPTINILIGHHEYRAFESHTLFLERDPKYRNRKGDPGPVFMRRLREGIADLGLKGPPPSE